VLSVIHQAWGARLGGGEDQRARIVSWREGLALLGVLVASVEHADRADEIVELLEQLEDYVGFDAEGEA
jgi:hypothetical protein